MNRFLSIIHYFIWIFWALFFVLIGWFAFQDWSKGEADQGPFKQVEIKGSMITGYEGSRRRFLVNAEYIWMSGSQYLFRAERVHDSTVFDSTGAVVLEGMSANFVRVNSKSKNLTAEGGVRAVLVGKDSTGFGTSLDQGASLPVVISCDEMTYYDLSGRAYLSGNVTLTQGDVTLNVKTGLTYDRELQTMTAEGVVIEAFPFTITANAMTWSLSDHQAILTTVTGVRQPTLSPIMDAREAQLSGGSTRFSADRLTYLSQGEGAKTIVLLGNVSLSQPDRQLRGDRGEYSQSEHSFRMTGRTVFHATSLSWLIDPDRNTSFTHPDIQHGATQPTDITCQSFYFNTQDHRLLLTGDVVLTQKDTKIKTKTLSYSDKDGDLELTGYVDIVRHGKSKLKASTLRFNVYTEATSIDGTVELELFQKP
jgi:lipopolysaccharide export system protein LptA